LRGVCFVLQYFMRNFRNLIVGLAILVPVFYLGILVYNPPEREAIARDKVRKDGVNLLARSLDAYFKKDGVYPQALSALEFVPPNLEIFTYKISEDGKNIIVYAEAESLASRQYCLQGTASILYSSDENRTAIICDDPPTPGPQDFVD